MKVRIYRTCKDNPLPTQANPNDAGWDCYASKKVIFAWPREVKAVPLGIIAEAPTGFHWKLCLRSSMVKRGLRLANSVGIIDALYCGPTDEIKALIQGDAGAVIEKGDRICQLILEKNYDIEWEEQEDINFGGKDRGGIGSSGA